MSNGLAPDSVSRMAKVRSSVCVAVVGEDCGGETEAVPLEAGGVLLATAGCGGKVEVD